MTCYADDTLCMLDGSVNSYRALFYDLGVFAKFSGLSPNIEKTHAMWVGNTASQQPVCPKLKMRCVKSMKVLGVIFQNDEDKCPKITSVKTGGSKGRN